MELDPTTSISAFYAGRSVFITGGTGFMGKVLVEKLLRSCPNIREIFLLMRPRKGVLIDNRLREMLALPLYDKLRETNPSAFEKLIPVTGDVEEEGLGLPTIERRVLIERVSVVFHVAASVRFDDHFKNAVLMNTRGTREVCILAASMKKLVVLLHVSTTYGNTHIPVVEEKLYPPHADWKKTIKIAEMLDEYTLATMTAKYIDKLPNTYTFAKQLAEHVIKDYAGVIPSVIFRPSVVISSMKEPVEGWVDNFNGPVGIMIGGGKGLLRTLYGNPDQVIDFIPVDIAIKGMIISAWKRGITTITKDPSVHVYNCANNRIKSITTGDMIVMAHNVASDIPVEGILWAPRTNVSSSNFLFYFSCLMYHLLPAMIVDAVLKLSGLKPRLVKVQRKVYTANMALKHFLLEEWKFENKNFMNLLNILPAASYNDFDFEFGTLDIRQYFRNAVIGSKLYLLNEDMKNLPAAKAHYDKMMLIDKILKVWLFVFLSWAGLVSGFFSSVLSSVSSVFDH